MVCGAAAFASHILRLVAAFMRSNWYHKVQFQRLGGFYTDAIRSTRACTTI